MSARQYFIFPLLNGNIMYRYPGDIFAKDHK